MTADESPRRHQAREIPPPNAPTSALPLEIGKLHFVGIGGIGMSGIAEVMLNLGYQVQGSDLKEGPTTERLRELGAEIFIGQKAENVGDARVVVISSAIRRDNPELMAARERALPVVRRAEMLAELMRLRWNVAVAGTHGKTTTTSLVASILDAGGVDPTVINGGIIRSYGSNARLGEGQWMVVEADESDGTFVKLPATIAIITNIDPEHMDHYVTIEALRDSFDAFASNIPFYGALVACIDHPEVQSLMGRITDRRIVTFGFSRQADIRGENVTFSEGKSHFDVIDRESGERWDGFELPMPGEHNVSNSLGAIAVGRELKIPMEQIRQGLASFKGVHRRFTRAGEWNGAPIIDDYAHHPTEIAAVLKAARASTEGKVIAIHQPHRFSRLHSLFEEFCGCFNDADVVGITDVYAAGEDPIDGISRDALVGGLRAHGHRGSYALKAPDGLPDFVRGHAEPGDLVVFLGAGSISVWAHGLQHELESQPAAAE